MAEFRERLEEAMKLRGVSAAELSKRTGISEGGISQYRKGLYKANQKNLEKIATALFVPIHWLMGLDDADLDDSPEELQKQFSALSTEQKKSALCSLVSNIQSLPKTVKKPRLGTIACGVPILAVEETDIYDDVPENIPCDFTLVCKGDSMVNARILDGDIVYLTKADTVEQGEIAAVIIGDEATLKRVYYSPGAEKITLCACNPAHADLVYFGDRLDQIHIIGKAVAFTSKIKT